jgi:hypothetical protein
MFLMAILMLYTDHHFKVERESTWASAINGQNLFIHDAINCEFTVKGA